MNPEILICPECGETVAGVEGAVATHLEDGSHGYDIAEDAA